MTQEKWKAYRMLDHTDENKRSIMLTVQPMPIGDIPMDSVHDGYHSFGELYDHRMHLFAIICNSYKHKAWKSWKHHPDNDPMYEDYFIVGISTPEGDYTYHYHKSHWDNFMVRELDHALKWDGHTPDDIIRLYSLIK